MAVVKADAYGHDAYVCAKTLETAGIDWFGVALPEEGVYLRSRGISKPILCLGSFWTGQENLLLNNNLTPVIYQIGLAQKYNQAAKEKGLKAKVHIKIDTGMGRIGVRFDEVKVFVEELKRLENIEVDGLMTHFAAADDLMENCFTNLQIERFNDAVKIFEANGFQPTYKDLANSPGAIAHKSSIGNLVRLGGILYGLKDDVLPQVIEKPDLKQVLTFYSQIVHIKRVPKGETLGYSRTFQTNQDSLIATIPVGYHDGYQRGLSNKSRVIINNTFAPVVGRISMDWTIVDVSQIPKASIGDKVVLIGKDRDLKITAEELAALTGTISYEFTCGISPRAYKIFVGGDRIITR